MSMVWLTRGSWAAIAAIAALPVVGRWLDPAPPPIKPPTDAAGVARLFLDVVTIAGHRAWMLPTVIGLAAFAVLVSVVNFALLVHGGAPWPRRWGSLWPLLALLLSVLLSILLDEHLPEFNR